MSELETSHTMATTRGSPPAEVYPMKELADRIHIPNVKTSFGLVKNLSAMVADGKIVEKMTNLRIIVFPSVFVLNIWSTFHEILGRKLAPKVLTTFHRNTGKTMVEVGKHAFKLEDKFAFEFYFWLISAIGWGQIKKFQFDSEKIEGVWQIEYRGPLPKNNPPGIPLHDNFRGEIMAAGEEALRVPLEVKETKCVATGDPFCEFVWQKADQLGKEADSIPETVFQEAAKRNARPTPQTLVLKKDFADAFNRVAMPEEGKMVDGDLVVATKDARSIIGLTYQASTLLGEHTVRPVLVRTGKLFAQDDVKRYASTGRQLVEDYLKWMSVSGWGMFRLLTMDENGGEATCERSVFAEEYPETKEPVCHLAVGILSTLVERAFNQKYMVKEKDCIAKGDEKCRFEVKKIPK